MIRRKVISATIAMSVFQGLGRGLDLLGTLIVARLISPEAFGIVAAAMIVLQLVSSLTELNIFDALVQREKLEQDDYDTAFTFGLLRGGIIVLIMLAVAYPFALSLSDLDIAYVTAALGIVPLARALRSPRLADYGRRVEYLVPVSMDFLGRLIGFITMLVIAFMAKSYWAIVAGLFLGAFIGTALSYVVAPYKPSLSMKKAKWLFGFSGWMNLFAATNAALGQFDRYFLGTRFGANLLGIYTVASSVASQLLWSLAAPIMNSLFAGLSNVKSDPARLRRAYLLGQHVIVAIMMPIGVGLAVIAEPGILLLMGPDWQSAGLLISILAPATALQMMTVGAQALSMALGNTRPLFIRNLIALAFNIPAIIWGTLIAGAIGAAAARALTIAFLVALNMSLVKSLISIGYVEQLRNCMRTLVSCLVMLVAVIALMDQGVVATGEPDLVGLLITIAGGAIVYTATHFALWRLGGSPDGIEAILTEQVQRVTSTLRKAH